MGILDMNDDFTNGLNFNNFEIDSVDQYINGIKQHEQPLVTVANEGKNVIYREQLQCNISLLYRENPLQTMQGVLSMWLIGTFRVPNHPKNTADREDFLPQNSSIPL